MRKTAYLQRSGLNALLHVHVGQPGQRVHLRLVALPV